MQVFKKIWFFIILIVLITAVSGTIYEIALGNHHLVQDRSKSFYQILREPENSVDAVVVGDSLSYTSISPMELWNDLFCMWTIRTDNTGNLLYAEKCF